MPNSAKGRVQNIAGLRLCRVEKDDGQATRRGVVPCSCSTIGTTLSNSSRRGQNDDKKGLRYIGDWISRGCARHRTSMISNLLDALLHVVALDNILSSMLVHSTIWCPLFTLHPL